MKLVISALLSAALYFLFWTENIYLLFFLVKLASSYDSIYLVMNDVYIGFLYPFLFSILFNPYLLHVYYTRPIFLFQVIIITQLSDLLQYLVGKNIGKWKIGWISPNKTWEGFIGGYILTVIILLYYYTLSDITIIYIFGVISGLVSSLYKRKIGIKDYSNLLGSHGGWFDRVDSVILPILLL